MVRTIRAHRAAPWVGAVVLAMVAVAVQALGYQAGWGDTVQAATVSGASLLVALGFWQRQRRKDWAWYVARLRRRHDEVSTQTVTRRLRPVTSDPDSSLGQPAPIGSAQLPRGSRWASAVVSIAAIGVAVTALVAAAAIGAASPSADRDDRVPTEALPTDGSRQPDPANDSAGADSAAPQDPDDNPAVELPPARSGESPSEASPDEPLSPSDGEPSDENPTIAGDDGESDTPDDPKSSFVVPMQPPDTVTTLPNGCTIIYGDDELVFEDCPGRLESVLGEAVTTGVVSDELLQLAERFPSLREVFPGVDVSGECDRRVAEDLLDDGLGSAGSPEQRGGGVPGGVGSGVRDTSFDQ